MNGDRRDETEREAGIGRVADTIQNTTYPNIFSIGLLDQFSQSNFLLK